MDVVVYAANLFAQNVGISLAIGIFAANTGEPNPCPEITNITKITTLCSAGTR